MGESTSAPKIAFLLKMSRSIEERTKSTWVVLQKTFVFATQLLFFETSTHSKEEYV